MDIITVTFKRNGVVIAENSFPYTEGQPLPSFQSPVATPVATHVEPPVVEIQNATSEEDENGTTTGKFTKGKRK